MKNDELILEVQRLARTRDGVLLIEFEITSTSKGKVLPEWLWLSQGGISRPIHGLALSSLELRSDRPIHGVMQILKADVSNTDPLRIELRRKKTSYLTIPKVASWK